ncbi:MAG: phage tail protein, partial [Candidatus Shapirobacteria bacterium]
MEMLEASFTTMLGSGEKATALMDQLLDMAKKTPFETSDLASGAKMLLQYGVSAESILPTLRMIGDVSTGNTEIFGRLTYVFGQIRSVGK